MKTIEKDFVNFAFLQMDRKTIEELSLLEKTIENSQRQPILVLSAEDKLVHCNIISKRTVHIERLGIIDGILSIDSETQELCIPCKKHVVRTKPDEKEWETCAGEIKVYCGGIFLSDKGTFRYKPVTSRIKTLLKETRSNCLARPNNSILFFTGTKEVGIYSTGNMISMEYVLSQLHDYRTGDTGVWEYLVNGDVLKIDPAISAGLRILGRQGQYAARKYKVIPVRELNFT